MAAQLTLAQLRAQMTLPGYASDPSLGLMYFSSEYAPFAQSMLHWLARALPGVQGWAGCVGVGVLGGHAEYIDEPALSVMLCDLPISQWRVFSGQAPLGNGFRPHSALVHADGNTPDLDELVSELGARTTHGLFGGLRASRRQNVQVAATRTGIAHGPGALHGGVFSGGLTGVAFAPGASLITQVAHGCELRGPAHLITHCEGDAIVELDGEPALDVMLDDLHASMCQPCHSVNQQHALVALGPAEAGFAARQRGCLDARMQVRPLTGLDVAARSLNVAARPQPGQSLLFCQRSARVARADLMRACTEIREQLESEPLPVDAASAPAAPAAFAQPARRMVGAVYVSCASRGSEHFEQAGAQIQLLRQALGEVPLTGFFAGGEIAGAQLHGYTGVLTVFASS